MNTINAIRSVCYVVGVFRNQKSDPLCGKCKALANSVNSVRERISTLETSLAEEPQKLPPDLAARYAEAKDLLASLDLPAGLSGQKKAGNCLLPQGVCLVKSALSILEKI